MANARVKGKEEGQTLDHRKKKARLVKVTYLVISCQQYSYYQVGKNDYCRNKYLLRNL